MKSIIVSIFSVLLSVTLCGVGDAQHQQAGDGKKAEEGPRRVDGKTVVEARVRLGLGYTEDMFVELLIRDKKVLNEEILVPLEKAKADPQPAKYIVVGTLSVKRHDGSVAYYWLYSPWGCFSNEKDKYYMADFQRLLGTLRKAMGDVMHNYPIRTEEEKGSERAQQAERDFSIAKDSKAFVYDRIAAASRLDEGGKARLRKRLVSELPGDWDVAMLHAVVLLGDVGDADTVRTLEALQQKSEAGKISVAITHAIEKIKGRERAKGIKGGKGD
jgi:hypothetical protein